MKINAIADARACMRAIHAQRRKVQPWATVQSAERHLEDAIASDKRVVKDDLARIERATELDSGIDLEERVREILEGE
jgi:hypothetical protein